MRDTQQRCHSNVLSKAAEWGVGAFVPSADVEGASCLISNTMTLKDALLADKVFIPNLSALFCANLLISRVELICLVLRCHRLFCMLAVTRQEKCGGT